MTRDQAMRLLIEYERAALSVASVGGIEGWGGVEEYASLRGIICRLLCGTATPTDVSTALIVGNTSLKQSAQVGP